MMNSIVRPPAAIPRGQGRLCPEMIFDSGAYPFLGAKLLHHRLLGEMSASADALVLYIFLNSQAVVKSPEVSRCRDLGGFLSVFRIKLRKGKLD
jgi:hypothetical protein